MPAVLAPRRRQQGRGRVLLGVNCRDLRTLQVSTSGASPRSRPLLPRAVPWVAESGIETPAQAADVARLGYSLALVGTALMRSGDPAAAAQALLQAGRGAVPGEARRMALTHAMRVFVKICGLTHGDSVRAAIEAGADAVGFVFAAVAAARDAEDAAELSAQVPPGILRVAVMRHPLPEEWEEVADRVRPDWLQTEARDFAALRLPAGVEALPVYRDVPGLDTAAAGPRRSRSFRSGRERHRAGPGLGARPRSGGDDPARAGRRPAPGKRRRGHPARAPLGRGREQRRRGEPRREGRRRGSRHSSPPCGGPNRNWNVQIS